MKFEIFLFGIALLAQIPSSRSIKFKDNGYYNVLVAISPDVEATHDERILIVDNIKVFKTWF